METFHSNHYSKMRRFQRRYFLLLIGLLVSFSLQAQVSPVRWDRAFGGNKNDYVFLDGKINLVPSKFGPHYFVIESSESDISGEKTEATRGKFDIWIVKFDATGAVIWDKTLGATENENSFDLLELRSGQLLVTARSWSPFASGDKSQDAYFPTAVRSDIWLVMLDSTGTKLWDRRYGSTQSEYSATAIELPSGHIAFAGGTKADTTMGGLLHDVSDNSIGGNDSWFFEIDTLGNILWDNRIGGQFHDETNDFVADGSGGFVTVGQCAGNASVDITHPPRGAEDVLSYRLDGAGNKIWDQRFGSPGIDVGMHIAALPGNSFLLCAWSLGGIGGDKTEANFGADDFWLIKMDDQGNKIWEKSYGGAQDDDPLKAIPTCDGNIVVVGFSYSSVSGNKTSPRKGGSDLWMIKLDPNGNKLWDIAIGGSGNEFNADLLQMPDGSYLLAGESLSEISGDRTQASRGMADVWVVNIAVRAEFVLPDTICPGDTVAFRDSSTVITEEWLWDFGDPASGVLNTSTDKNPTHVFLQPGVYPVRQIVRESCQWDTIVHNLVVMAIPVANAGNDTLICKGDPAMIGSATVPGYTYFWTPPGELSAANIPQPTFGGDSSATFFLEVFNGPCPDLDTIHIEVVAANAGQDTFVCPPAAVVLQSQFLGNFTVQWSPAASMVNANDLQPSVFPATTTDYFMIANAGNCVIMDTVTVLAYPHPTASFGAYPAVGEIGTPIDFLNGSQFSVLSQWDFGDGSNLDSAQSTVHTYTEDGNYAVQLVVTNTLGCTDTTIFEVVIATPSQLFIPNAFSPTGDGLNDRFDVYGIEVEEFQLSIFARGGQLIFVSDRIEDSWDGTYKGEAAPEGMYLYQIKARLKDVGAVSKSGSMLLLR
jgi:gliding motility-associated-like protein